METEIPKELMRMVEKLSEDQLRALYRFIVARLRLLFNRNKFLFDLPSASLVHGDLSAGFKNILIAGDKITGIVDMEGVSAADSINEFAWYHFWTGWDKQDFEALKEGYDNQGLFDDNFMKKLYLYQLPLAYSLAVYYHERNSQGGLNYVQAKIPVIEKSFDKL